MTPYALFAEAFLVPAAIAVLVAGAVRSRRSGLLWVGKLACAVSAVFLLGSGLLFAGWLLPDAVDELPPEERAVVAPVLRSSPECNTRPFARVLEVQLDRSEAGAPVVRYSCGVTPFGVLRLENEAHCADGQWRVPGRRDVAIVGSC